VFLLNVGFFGGRVVALISDGMPSGIVPLVMLMELALFVIAFLLARRAAPA